MKVMAAWIGVLLLSASAAAEDPHLREKAITLLEKANVVSTPAVLPPHQAVITFRFFSATEGAEEGQRTIVSLGSGQFWSEVTFGDFHVINIVTPHRLAASGENNSSLPAPVRRLSKLMPIYLVRFDHEDVINSIDDSQVRGRPARCIGFDTKFGSTLHANEICVDKENGTLLRLRNGNEVTENSEFFLFSGAYWPARVDYYQNGVEVLEVHDRVTAIEGQPDLNLLLPPPGAQILVKCQQYRRPFAQKVVQPPSGSGGETVDLVVYGTIGEDGRLHDGVVELSDRPDLQGEALQIAAKWVFTPATCDGKPSSEEGNLVLHFQNR